MDYRRIEEILTFFAKEKIFNCRDYEEGQYARFTNTFYHEKHKWAVGDGLWQMGEIWPVLYNVYLDDEVIATVSDKFLESLFKEDFELKKEEFYKRRNQADEDRKEYFDTILTRSQKQ